MYRQGDILIVAVDKIPSVPEIERAAGAAIVLALGEVTGHSHTITLPSVKWFGDVNAAQYVQSAHPFEVLHQEHGALTLPPGSYMVIRQVEYTPAAIRRVMD